MSDLFLHHNAYDGKRVTLQLTWMSFLKNRGVCFNQERLPKTHHNLHHTQK